MAISKGHCSLFFCFCTTWDGALLCLGFAAKFKGERYWNFQDHLLPANRSASRGECCLVGLDVEHGFRSGEPGLKEHGVPEGALVDRPQVGAAIVDHGESVGDWRSDGHLSCRAARSS